MAKLFCTVESEKNEVHKIANRELDIKIYYGDREDSKLAMHIVVSPNPQNPHEKPNIFVENRTETKPIILQV